MTRTQMVAAGYEPLCQLEPGEPNRWLLSFHYCRSVGKRSTRFLDFDRWTASWPDNPADVFADSGGFAGTNDNWAAFDRYLDDGVTYMALGGMVGQPSSAVYRFVVEAHRRAAGRCVFHGFGLTNWTLIRDLPWYSIDSSTWTQAMRFGSLNLFDPDHHAWHKLFIPRHDRDAGHYKVTRREAASVWACADVLRRVYDIDPELLIPPEPIPEEHWTSFLCARINEPAAKTYRLVEQYLRARHGTITVPGRPELEPGLRLYLASNPVYVPGAPTAPIPGLYRDGLTIEEPHADQPGD